MFLWDKRDGEHGVMCALAVIKLQPVGSETRGAAEN